MRKDTYNKNYVTIVRKLNRFFINFKFLSFHALFNFYIDEVKFSKLFKFW